MTETPIVHHIQSGRGLFPQFERLTTMAHMASKRLKVGTWTNWPTFIPRDIQYEFETKDEYFFSPCIYIGLNFHILQGAIILPPNSKWREGGKAIARLLATVPFVATSSSEVTSSNGWELPPLLRLRRAALDSICWADPLSIRLDFQRVGGEEGGGAKKLLAD